MHLILCVYGCLFFFLIVAYIFCVIASICCCVCDTYLCQIMGNNLKQYQQKQTCNTKIYLHLLVQCILFSCNWLTICFSLLHFCQPGERFAHVFHLEPVRHGYSVSYNENVNPGTINSFTTAAYRSFHSIIQGTLELSLIHI